MTYRIARNGELFGPYSLIEVQRYLASGRITPTDLGQPEGGEEWLPVAELFPLPAPYKVVNPGGLPVLYRDPPDLPWWLALILGVFTIAAFFVVWDIVQSAWLRRIDRRSTALNWYIAVAVLYLLKLPNMWHTIDYNILNGPLVEPHYSLLLSLTGLALFFVSRYTMRSDLLRHFNSVEPIGLRLGWFMTLFGGLYFQYHFNRINEVKRALHVSVPAA
ncbi:MAG: DUF4339 domain-containing protein [Acidobacteriota bacterium]